MTLQELREAHVEGAKIAPHSRKVEATLALIFRVEQVVKEMRDTARLLELFPTEVAKETATSLSSFADKLEGEADTMRRDWIESFCPFHGFVHLGAPCAGKPRSSPYHVGYEDVGRYEDARLKRWLADRQEATEEQTP